MRIGFNRCGGLGDGVSATAAVVGMRQKFPDSHITGYLYGSPHTVFEGHPSIDKLVEVQSVEVVGRLKEDVIRERYGDWDVWYDLKPVPRVFFRDGFRHLETEKNRIWKENLKHLAAGYIRSCSGLGALRVSQMDLLSDALDLPYNLPWWPKYPRTGPGDYVTICNEAWGECPTKTWYNERWEQVAGFCMDRGFEVYQVGEFSGNPIDGVHDLSGACSFDDACRVAANSRAHLGIEGYWNHFCAAVGVPAVTIFGPTPVSFWGYGEGRGGSKIINVLSRGCEDCWWETDQWMNECPKGCPVEDRECMNSITAQMVSDAAGRVLSG